MLYQRISLSYPIQVMSKHTAQKTIYHPLILNGKQDNLLTKSKACIGNTHTHTHRLTLHCWRTQSTSLHLQNSHHYKKSLLACGQRCTMCKCCSLSYPPNSHYTWSLLLWSVPAEQLFAVEKPWPSLSNPPVLELCSQPASILNTINQLHTQLDSKMHVQSLRTKNCNKALISKQITTNLHQSRCSCSYADWIE